MRDSGKADRNLGARVCDCRVGRRLAPLLGGAILVSVAAASGVAQQAGPLIPGGAVTLPPIEVEAQRPASAGEAGYAAGSSRTGTKTDAPLTEVPQAVSVISRDQMDAQNARTVAEALGYTAGVQTGRYGLDPRFDSIQIRGFDSTTFADFRDGLKQPSSGFQAYFKTDPYSLERIDVVKGPASVLYGQATPGGLVNRITKRPQDVPLREVELQYGSFARYQGAFDLSGPVDAEGRLLYRLTGLGRDSGTDLEGADDDRAFLAPAVTWRPSDATTLTFLTQALWSRTVASATYFQRPDGELTKVWAGDKDFDRLEQTQLTAGYELEHRPGEALTLRQNLRYGYIQSDEQYTLEDALLPDGRTIARSAFGIYEHLSSLAVDNQAELRGTTGPVEHTLLAGADYQRLWTNSKYVSGPAPSIDLFEPDNEQSFANPETDITRRNLYTQQAGLYLQDQLALGRWRAVAGLRQDLAVTELRDRLTGTTAEQSDEALTWRVGLLYASAIGLSPYVSYATSFLPQTDAADGEPFKPTRGRQWEAGVKLQPPGWDSFATVSGFQITQKNVPTDDPDSLDPTAQVQAGEIRSRGVEVEALGNVAEGVDVTAAYTFQDVEITRNNDGSQGNRPAGVPRHLASLWADYTQPFGGLAGLGGGLGVRYVGGSFSDDLHDGRTNSDYVLLDAVLHYDWRGARFALNADNLFDKEYERFEDGFGYRGEGRSLVGSVRLRW